MDQKRYDQGLAVRRAVLGAEYVDKSVKAPDEFSKPMQDLVTEYCWGEVWTRPELDRKTRSFLNLGMLTAKGQPDHIIDLLVAAGSQASGALNTSIQIHGNRGVRQILVNSSTRLETRLTHTELFRPEVQIIAAGVRCLWHIGLQELKH